MSGRKRKRKLWWVLGTLLAVLLFGVAGLPVWFPWVLRPVVQRLGVTYDSFETISSTQGLVKNAKATFGQTTIEAKRLRLFLPNRWLWCLFVTGNAHAPFVQVADWSVHSEPSAEEKAPGTNSTSTVLNDLNHLAPTLRHWLPYATLTNGVVEAAGQKVQLPEALWRDGVLTATAQPRRLHKTVSLRANFQTNGQFGLDASVKSLRVEAHLQFQQQPQAWNLTGDVFWQSNQVNVTAVFDYDQWLPAEARVQAQDVRLPEEVLKLDGYRDLQAALDLNWQTNQYTIALQASASPVQTNALQTPPIKLLARAQGTLKSVTLEELRLTAPGAQGELAQSVQSGLAAPSLNQPAQINLSFDLSKLALHNVTGQLTGTLEIQPGPTNPPTARLELHGRSVAVGPVMSQELSLVCRLHWPVLVLEQAKAAFNDGSAFSAAAQLNLKSRELADGQWQFQGPLLRQFLSTNVGYASFQATGQFHGPLAQPSHAGDITMKGLFVPGLKKCDAHLDWQGQALNLSQLEMALQSKAAQLRCTGTVQAVLTNGTSVALTLKTLDWQRENQPVYTLEKPCQIIAQRLTGGQARSAWTVKIDALHWTGKDRELQLAGQVAWPRSGDVRVQIRNLDPTAFGGLFALPATEGSLKKLDLQARWQDGPVDFELGLEAHALAKGTPLDVEGHLQGGAHGFRFNRSGSTRNRCPPWRLKVAFRSCWRPPDPVSEPTSARKFRSI